MKTTKATAALKRLDELTVKSENRKHPLSKNSMAYKFAKQVIDGDKTIRPCHTSGAKKFTSNQDHTALTMIVLNKIGIEFELSNDSKRGGLTGNLITIKTKII